MENRVVRQWVRDQMCEAIEVMLHAVLYRIDAYPRHSFRQHARFGGLFMMCDIEEVHDYVASIRDALRQPLFVDLVESVDLLIFEGGSLKSRFQILLPINICEALAQNVPTDSHTEFHVTRLLEEWLKDSITEIYRTPALIVGMDVEWRVLVGTKDGNMVRDRIPTELIVKVPEELLHVIEQMEQRSTRYPIFSHATQGTETACISLSVDSFQ